MDLAGLCRVDVGCPAHAGVLAVAVRDQSGPPLLH